MCFPSSLLLVLLLLLSNASSFLVVPQQQYGPFPKKILLYSAESSSNNNNNLPEIPGDYDWDARYQDDDDWITGTNSVPGKMKLSPQAVAQQSADLASLEEKWKKAREMAQYDADRIVGWVPKAELMNGRFAMFFLVVGLLTEYWTGISMPGQVEELGRVLGIIGF